MQDCLEKIQRGVRRPVLGARHSILGSRVSTSDIKYAKQPYVSTKEPNLPQKSPILPPKRHILEPQKKRSKISYRVVPEIGVVFENKVWRFIDSGGTENPQLTDYYNLTLLISNGLAVQMNGLFKFSLSSP